MKLPGGWLSTATHGQNAILKNGDVSIKSNNVSAAAYHGLLYKVPNEILDTGPFDPWTYMQIILFVYSKILMKSLEMRENHKTTHTSKLVLASNHHCCMLLYHQ